MKKRPPAAVATSAVEPIPEDSDAVLDTGSLELSGSDSEASSYSSDEVASDVSFESSGEDSQEPRAAAETAAAASDQDELDRAVLDYVVASQQQTEVSASPEQKEAAAEAAARFAPVKQPFHILE